MSNNYIINCMNPKTIVIPNFLSENSLLPQKRQTKFQLQLSPSFFQPHNEAKKSLKNHYDKRPSLHLPTEKQADQKEKPIENLSTNSNLEFIKSLVPLKDHVFYEQNEQIPLDSEYKLLVGSGEVKVVGINEEQYRKGSGYFFFVSQQAKRKIRKMVAITSTVLYLVSQKIFKEFIRNYLFIKNAEKIKYLKYCPFIPWNYQIAEDIAVTMELDSDLKKDYEIYQSDDDAEYLYFVKEGIVLLERTRKIQANIINEYEKYYESSYLNEEQCLLIARKGMVFGVDGILIKERVNKNCEEEKLLNKRFYNAKSIGNCEIYRLHRKVIEVFYKLSDIIKRKQEHKSLEKQKDELSTEYTNVLKGVDKKIKALKKNQYNFGKKLTIPVDHELQRKRKRIQDLKSNQIKAKKLYGKSKDSKRHKQAEGNGLKKRAKKQEVIILEKLRNISLPTLEKKKLEKTILKKSEEEKIQNYKKKIQEEIIIKEKPKNENRQNLHFMKVHSYRNLFSSMN